MHRIKNGHEYYCIPGGHPEAGETPEQTAIREIKEEASLNIKLDKILCELPEFNHSGTVLYFLTTQFKGIAELSGPEKERNCLENQYRLEWVKLDQLKTIRLYPQEIVIFLDLKYLISETRIQIHLGLFVVADFHLILALPQFLQVLFY